MSRFVLSIFKMMAFAWWVADSCLIILLLKGSKGFPSGGEDVMANKTFHENMFLKEKRLRE